MTDILELFAIYAAYATTVFGLAYGATGLFRFFKEMASPSFRDRD